MTFRNAFRFLKDARGNIAPIFAIALVPTVALMGAAVDYTRANEIKVALQTALDSTTLAMAPSAAQLTADDLTAKATTYFNALFKQPGTTGVQLKVNYSTSNGAQIVMTAATSVKTDFMSLPGFGIEYIGVNASSTATWGNSRLRVALVLDNTGSMSSSGKITALKTATNNLLNQLKAAATSPDDVYVSIIPFVKDVNVGSSNYNASWIDWTDWDANNGTCSQSGLTTKNSCTASGTCSKSSYSSQSACTSHGTCSKSSYSSQGSCVANSGIWTPYTWTSATWTPKNHGTWNGCIADRGTSAGPADSRTAGNDQGITAPVADDSTTLFPAEQYNYCPHAMMGLTNNWSDLTSLVNGMSPNGSTNQPIGLVWGWQSLVGGGPLTAPALASGYTYQQVIILLSDGLNTQDRWYGNGSNVSSQVDDRMCVPNATASGCQPQYPSICQNIKNAGITIYTIQVNTDGEPTSNLLKSCATSADNFFLLTSSNQIITVFNQIGTKLAKLHVAK